MQRVSSVFWAPYYLLVVFCLISLSPVGFYFFYFYAVWEGGPRSSHLVVLIGKILTISPLSPAYLQKLRLSDCLVPPSGISEYLTFFFLERIFLAFSPHNLKRDFVLHNTVLSVLSDDFSRWVQRSSGLHFLTSPPPIPPLLRLNEAASQTKTRLPLPLNWDFRSSDAKNKSKPTGQSRASSSTSELQQQQQQNNVPSFWHFHSSSGPSLPPPSSLGALHRGLLVWTTRGSLSGEETSASATNRSQIKTKKTFFVLFASFPSTTQPEKPARLF